MYRDSPSIAAKILTINQKLERSGKLHECFHLDGNESQIGKKQIKRSRKGNLIGNKECNIP